MAKDTLRRFFLARRGIKLVLNKKELEALKRFLKWLRGFEESTLYEDYKKHENFTDEEYDKTVHILSNLILKNKLEKVVFT